MLVHQFLENSAQKTPDAPAVWFQDEWASYGVIDQLSDRVAGFLMEKGIGKGDRVALLYDNSIDYVIQYYAILKTGAITVALNTASTIEKLEYLLNDCGAKCLISHQKFARKISAVLPNLVNLTCLVLDKEDVSEFSELYQCHVFSLKTVYRLNIERKEKKIQKHEIASIVYTSGSTGKAKGVVLTHSNIVHNTQSIVTYLKLTSSDRIMTILPFYYIYGKSLLNTHFSVGGSVVIDNRFAFPAVILETMKRMQVTGLSGVPSNFIILLNRSNVRDYCFESLRYVTQAGGAMPVSVQKEVAEVFDPAKLFIMYGATEASARLSYLEPELLHQKWGSIGMAIPGVTLSIVNDAGEVLPCGEIGEIVAKGSNIMKGYWNDPHETENVLRNHMYYTGDLGRIDEDGYFYVVGRKKEMIKVGGERISPKEIEEIIYTEKEVAEAAVIGVQDELLGEAIYAFVVLKPNEDIPLIKLEKQIKRKLPPYMYPRKVQLVDELPKNKSGKIMKAVLYKKIGMIGNI